jgi:hypothetical protein
MTGRNGEGAPCGISSVHSNRCLFPSARTGRPFPGRFWGETARCWWRYISTRTSWKTPGGGCSDALWLRLAQARETTEPEGSIPIYLRLAEAGIANASGHRYDDAVKLLEHAARLRQALGQGPEFHLYLDALRQKYKAKRNFQKRVEERRRWLYLQPGGRR